jgi:hypothetical protein
MAPADSVGLAEPLCRGGVRDSMTGRWVGLVVLVKPRGDFFGIAAYLLWGAYRWGDRWRFRPIMETRLLGSQIAAALGRNRQSIRERCLILCWVVTFDQRNTHNDQPVSTGRNRSSSDRMPAHRGWTVECCALSRAKNSQWLPH